MDMAVEVPEAEYGLTIDVVADLACPVSFLGKRSLDRALEHYQGPARLSWHPFQLNPDIPPGGISFERYLKDRFGGRAAVAPALERLQQAGRTQGIRFAFERLKRVPNTLDAHRLLQIADRHGCQHQLADRLFRAFFEQGEDIGDRSVLMQHGTASGLHPKDIAAELSQDSSLKIVLAREAEMRAAGIAGVPSYLVNRQLLLPGAQDINAFLTAFQQAAFPQQQVDAAKLH